MKQQNLFTNKTRTEFGGTLLQGRRKSRRPLATRRPIHIVLIPSQNQYRKWIRAMTGSLARKIRGLKFLHRPWTRVATWGWAFRKIQTYIAKNAKEAEFILTMNRRTDEFAKSFKEFATQIRPHKA